MTDYSRHKGKKHQTRFKQMADLDILASSAPAVRLAGANILALSAMVEGGTCAPYLPRPGAVPDSGAPDYPSNPLPKGVNPLDVMRCHVTERLVVELFASACDRDLPKGAAQRRPRCHTRQIAMYLSHVVLSVPYRTISHAFGRDRTTVVHACAVVEDRRDDEGYDRFVTQCERCICAVFVPFGGDNDID